MFIKVSLKFHQALVLPHKHPHEHIVTHGTYLRIGGSWNLGTQGKDFHVGSQK